MLRNILCFIGIHRWKIVRSISASNLLFFIKKKKQFLNKIQYNIDKDFMIYDRECIFCSKKDYNIDETKKIFIKNMLNLIKFKSGHRI